MATINGTAGNDTLVGEAGADIINGLGGDDVLKGSGGADAMNGGPGQDTVDYIGSGAAISIHLSNGTPATGGSAAGDTFSEIERARGSNHNDTITGTDQSNTIDGANGNDTINGGNGDDLLTGGPGADTLNGGSGKDRASYANSAAGVSILLTITDGSPNGFGGDAAGDRLSDIEEIDGSSHADVIVGAGGGIFGGGDGFIGGGGGNDTLFGGSWLLGASTGDDVITGGDGDDAIFGGDGKDKLAGEAGADGILGGAGDDGIQGGAGADILFGGSFTDTGVFATGSGNDQIFGGEGDDAIWGMDGDDVLIATEVAAAPGVFEYVNGGAGTDQMGTFGASNTYLIGEAGDDQIVPGLGVDYIWGDDPSNPAVTGADIFVFRALCGYDSVFDFRASDGDKLWLSTAFGVPTFEAFIARVTISSGGLNTGYTVFISDNGQEQLTMFGTSVSQWVPAMLEFIPP